MNNGTATPAATPAAPRTSRLANVISGKLEKPLRVVLYATDGLGKSTFASRAPSPIFIGAENGTAQLDVKRMPDITCWADIMESLVELETGSHDYKTVVLDTADWAEPMCWALVCATNGWSSIDDPGYGKGPSAALDEWRVLLARFERLYNLRGMHVILLAHCLIKQFKNPEQAGDFDRYEMALNPKASGLLRQWADCVLFGNYETFTNIDKNKRVRGVSTGARIVHTQRMAAFDAKNRFGLPETLPLDWDAFMEAVAASRPAEPATLRAKIDELLIGASEELAAKVKATVAENANDANYLARVLNKLAAMISTQENAK